MESFKIINDILDIQYPGITQSELFDFYRRNQIKPIIEGPKIHELLGTELDGYLNYLLYIDNNFHYYKELILEKVLQPDLYWNSQYLLCLYCNNPLIYRENHKLIKHLIEKINIRRFTGIPEELLLEILKQYYLYNEKHPDLNLNKDVSEIKLRYLPSKEYQKIAGKFNPNYIDEAYDENFYIWYEELVFMIECQRLQKNNAHPVFVSRDCGDGYGYDILSYDYNTRKEQLIEVKAWESEKFILTKNEYQVMKKCHQYNAEYYVYKYLRGINNNYCKVLKYDPLTEGLVDTLTNEYYELCEEKNNEGKLQYRVKNTEHQNKYTYQYIR